MKQADSFFLLTFLLRQTEVKLQGCESALLHAAQTTLTHKEPCVLTHELARGGRLRSGSLLPSSVPFIVLARIECWSAPCLPSRLAKTLPPANRNWVSHNTHGGLHLAEHGLQVPPWFFLAFSGSFCAEVLAGGFGLLTRDGCLSGRPDHLERRRQDPMHTNIRLPGPNSPALWHSAS